MAESPESQSEPQIPEPASKVSLEEFTLIKVIGKGTYGKVMLVRHKKVCYAIEVVCEIVCRITLSMR